MSDSVNTGQKLIDYPEIVTKLETAYSMGCKDSEACLFAGISTATLYAYIKRFPSFSDRKEKLKEYPILNAKKKVTSEIAEDVKVAQWYLERKTKEFGPPNQGTHLQFNQLNLLTESQIKDRLAHKLSRLLTNNGDKNCNTNCNTLDIEQVTGSSTADTSNTEADN